MRIENNLKGFLIQSQMGQIEESASIEVEDAALPYTINQDVEFAVAGEDRKYFVSESTKGLEPRGWTQRLECINPVAKNAKAASSKTLTYITMTRQEYKDFLDSTFSISLLDYVPFIRFGDDFGVGGWSMQSIVSSLAGLMGAPIVCLLPDYWVKQFSVSLGEPFWQAILSLVSPFKPQIFSVGGLIFITGDFGAIYPSDNNVLNARLVSEKIVRSENPLLLKTGGDLGFFRPNRYKGYINTDYRTFTKNFGNVEAKFDAYGYEEEYAEVETGDPSLLGEKDIDLETGMFEGYTKEVITQGYGLDAFGKRAFEVGENRNFYKFKGGIFINSKGKKEWDGSSRLVLARRESKTNIFKNTHLRYLSPIEVNREEVVDALVWHFPQGAAIFEFYKKLKDKKTEFIYDELSGELLTQSTYEKGAVYTEDGEEFKPLEFLRKDDIVEGAIIGIRPTLTEIINYTQHTKDSYGVRRTISYLGQDGKFTTLSEIQSVQAGAIQGERVQYRKMPVYAESTIGGTAPPKEMRIYTPSWESIELLTAYLTFFQSAAEIYRTYEVFGELNVHLGLHVNLPMETHHAGPQLPAPVLSPLYWPTIVAYSIQGDAHRAVTRFTVKGRLN